MRNISYLNIGNDDVFIIIYPKWNNSTEKQANKFIKEMLLNDVKEHVKILYWEDLISKAIEINKEENNNKVLNSLIEFREKYLDFNMHS